jgi:RNA polymerase sigma-70 factor (ECF subfamily)
MSPMAETDALTHAVEAALARARQAWPSLAVPDGTFGEELARRSDANGDPVAECGKLNVEDLYFVLACARGDHQALGEFERRHVPQLLISLQRRGLREETVNEAVQALRHTLFVARDGEAPRILEYGARGPLRGWLRVVATRLAFRMVRPEKRNVSFDESMDDRADGDIELSYLKKKYGAAFRQAFRESLESLPVRDRLLLKQRFVLHMTVTDLGVLHGVDASTVSRWATTARERLVEGTRTAMMRQLHLSENEAASVLRLIRSQIDISLSTPNPESPSRAMP